MPRYSPRDHYQPPMRRGSTYGIVNFKLHDSGRKGKRSKVIGDLMTYEVLKLESPRTFKVK